MGCLPWALSLTSFSRTLTVSHRENKLGLQYPWLAMDLNISIGPFFAFPVPLLYWPYILPFFELALMIQFTCISITRSTSNALTPAQKVHLLISPAKENTCKHHQKTSQVRTTNRLHDINKNSPRQRRQKLGRAISIMYIPIAQVYATVAK